MRILERFRIDRPEPAKADSPAAPLSGTVPFCLDSPAQEEITPAPSLPGAFLAGLAGSVAMTGCHETTRRLVPRAPRLDSLGRRALAGVFRAADQAPPDRDRLQTIALAGDVAFNAGLFGASLLVGPPASAPVRGVVVGVLAGLATLALPPKLKIGPEPERLSTTTKLITLGLYVGGGLVAGLVYRRRFDEGAGGS